MPHLDVCVLHDTLGHRDITSICESIDPPDTARYIAIDISMDDLKTCLTEFLSIEDMAISICDFTLISLEIRYRQCDEHR